VVDVADAEMVELLEQRDGPLADRSWPHSSEGECRYSELYKGQPCPWCEAEKRRRQREAAEK
jgi:hypothetical protein